MAQTIFINGKMKRIRRPPMIEGLTVDEFIRRNADPIWLHQEGLWEYIETEIDLDSERRRPTPMPSSRELVSFITTVLGEDLVIGYAIDAGEPGEVFSLILQRHPEFEMLLPPEERGVTVSHEAFPDIEGEMATRIVVNGLHVDIETTVRGYHIDLTGVDGEEVADALEALRRMHRHGGFGLEFR